MRIWLSIFFLFLCLSAGAQEFPPKIKKDSFKVGLVLSGGGAKGLAHIGALKIIEKAGVEIDYIAGSSMGAIIGSLYAIGYTPQQMDSIFAATNFQALIVDDFPRRAKNFYQKENAERYALSLPFDNFNISLPSGLSKGQNLYNLLARLMAPVSQIENFKNLPTPFFCIATNVENGNEVVLDSGSLPQAVTASGAIPSFFNPVKIDGQLYVDGGVTNNYPVRKLRKKGMDFIIGVDVQDSYKSREELESAIDIMTQVANFSTIKAMKEKKGLTDLYIHPNIKKFSILSFEKGRAIIKAGKIAAQKKLDSLQLLARKQKALQKQRTDNPVKIWDSIAINQIHIKGESSYPRSYIRGKLRIPTHKKISYQEFNQGIENLASTENFRRIEYRLEPIGDGFYDVTFFITENKNDTQLKFALHYDQLYQSALLVNITSKSLLFTNDVVSLDLIGGNNFRYNFNYYIDKGNYWSIGFEHSLNQFDKDVGFDFVKENSNFTNNSINQVEINYLDVTSQLYLETMFFDNFIFEAGIEHKYTEMATQTIFARDIPPQANKEEIPAILEKGSVFGTYGLIKFDSYDNAYFPEKGMKFMASLHLYLFNSSATSYNFSEFSVFNTSLGYAVSPLEFLSLRAKVEAGLRLGNTRAQAFNFFLGGYGNDYVNYIKPFLGYEHLAISGDSYNKITLEADLQPFKNHHLVLTYNIANVQDDLYETTDWITEMNYTGFGIGYGVETIVGPLELKYTYSPEREQSEWFLSLGFWF